MPGFVKKLLWKKVLTREYSFLYIDYAINCFKSMESLVGATIKFNLFHGEKNLVTIYRIEEDVKACYGKIDAIAASNPQRIVGYMDAFDELVAKNYGLIAELRKTVDKSRARDLLIELDETFYETLCHYLFFVYLGYAADYPNISEFLVKHRARFNEIRKYTIDTDVDSTFPELFSRYDEKLRGLVPYLSRAELMSFIKNNSGIDLGAVSKRKKEYLRVMKDGKVFEYDDEKISVVLSSELSHIVVDKSVTELKGTVAHPGLVRGKVSVVYSPNDFKKVKEGDVVVTPMTKPNMVPFLSKVRGIITNDGGALCHASIISRELNIPCIVGTTNATDVLKDGDEVILDANKGIIKKIR